MKRKKRDKKSRGLRVTKQERALRKLRAVAMDSWLARRRRERGPDATQGTERGREGCEWTGGGDYRAPNPRGSGGHWWLEN